MRQICVITGTRAEYDLLRWVMESIRHASDLRLQLIVTGAHLSPEFGLTYTAIEADGFTIDRKVEMLLSSDTAVGVTKSMGLALGGFADALDQLRPDLVLVLGDRYEIFAAAAAAMVARIPIAHLHGGETTEGAIDEAIRHSITKMAHLHFVAAEEYRQRVIQLGEHPERVFLVGGLGVDSILRLELLERSALETALDFRFQSRNLLVTFYPVTLEQASAASQMAELLAALDDLDDTGLIFTLPNADTDGRVLFPMYAAHRAEPRPESTDWAIYSPDVPVFRQDDGTALPQPWLLSILTYAAPFAPFVGQPAAGDLLEQRIWRVLAIAQAFRHAVLVLGAWGCGAFKNDPQRTARDFRRALETDFRGAFSHVVFAIADGSPDRRFLGPFREVFAAMDR